jgi:hypothetical protein
VKKVPLNHSSDPAMTLIRMIILERLRDHLLPHLLLVRPLLQRDQSR